MPGFNFKELVFQEIYVTLQSPMVMRKCYGHANVQSSVPKYVINEKPALLSSRHDDNM